MAAVLKAQFEGRFIEIIGKTADSLWSGRKYIDKDVR